MRAPLLASLVLAASAAATSALTGCYASRGYIVEESPPPPREEVVTYRPGYVWIHGHWNRPYGRRGWAWSRGYYERERPGYVYSEGRWERRGRGYVFVNGSWHRDGTVVVRRR